MALSLHQYCLLNILHFILLPYLAIISTSQHCHHKGIKCLNFTLFDQDTLNKTDFNIVNGVAGAGFSSTTDPFGTVAVVQDPLTLTPSSTSEVVGTAEGITITSSMDGLDGIIVITYFLNYKGYKGTLSIVGVANSIKPSQIPVVGGTGDFLFVHGYLTTSLVNITGTLAVYQTDFHLYWPPYAVDHKSARLT